MQQAFEDVRCVDSSKVSQPKYGVQVDRTDHKDVGLFWQLPPKVLVSATNADFCIPCTQGYE